ncbi:MAG TPA: ATP-binding protein [Candidatus Peribacteraceae bacterium]|nr:ATP-binding protein [Candidatus Peribacteraceae bacterium]
MFKRISRTLALQFTGFMFLLFLINGALFLAADFDNTRRQADFRIARESQMMMGRMPIATNDPTASIPPPLRDHVRIVTPSGKPIYEPGIFTDVPFVSKPGTAVIVIQNEPFTVVTKPITASNQVVGYLQIAEPARAVISDLPQRALLYLLVTLVVSGLTYMVALFFVKRSLAPAEDMFLRLQQFTQDASHELRTPLAILGSSLDVALKTENYKEGILSAKEDLHQVAVLIERLLELAQLDSFTLDKKTVDLSDLVSQSCDKFAVLAKKASVAIKADIAANVHVQGDAALIRQVIANLISNAIKFNKKKGSVTVMLTKNELDISDTGIGIDASDLPHVFDRFYQADTSRSEEGYGLGLALVKRIVDLHGWKISAKSKKDEGTTFSVHFSTTRKS